MINRNIPTLLLVLPAIMLNSCEIPAGGSGIILAADSKVPIAHARIIQYLGNEPSDTAYTNVQGRFEIFKIVNCGTSCPEEHFIISNKGFKDKILNVSDEEDNDPDFNRDHIRIFLLPY